MSDVPRFGLACALTTPFDGAGRIECDRLVEHARSRLAAGCTSVALFGTTGEGPSLAAREREAVLDAFARSGLDVGRQVIVMPSATAAGDVVEQMTSARQRGVRRFLLPPPFYFKGPCEAGLEAWFHTCLAPVANDDVEVLLYNIPPVTLVPLPIPMIGRLAAAYPRIVTGVKDSSGDWPYSERLLAEFAGTLAILIGDERHLARAVRSGGSGAISGCANFMPDVLLPMANRGIDDPRMVLIVEALLEHPVTPAVKAMLAHCTGLDGWRNVTSPLTRLDDVAYRRLAAAYDRAMAMPPPSGG